MSLLYTKVFLRCASPEKSIILTELCPTLMPPAAHTWSLPWIFISQMPHNFPVIRNVNSLTLRDKFMVHNLQMLKKTTRMLRLVLLTWCAFSVLEVMCSLPWTLSFSLRVAAVNTTLVTCNDPQHKVWAFLSLLTEVVADFAVAPLLLRNQGFAWWWSSKFPGVLLHLPQFLRVWG